MSIFCCSNLNLAATRFCLEPFLTKLTLISKEPSASIKPESQPFLSKSELSLGLQFKEEPVLLFIHSIRDLKCSILGPRKLPFIKPIIFIKSEIV